MCLFSLTSEKNSVVTFGYLDVLCSISFSICPLMLFLNGFSNIAASGLRLLQQLEEQNCKMMLKIPFRAYLEVFCQEKAEYTFSLTTTL